MEPETYSLKLDFDTAMRVKEMMVNAIADEEENEKSSGATSADLDVWRKSQAIVCDQLKSQGI